MKKIITEDLILEKLEQKKVLDHYSIDEDLAQKQLENHFDFKLTDNWNNTPDYSIYAETTADGYEVWVATDGDGRNVCINEDVHYYENDLAESLIEACTDYLELIYVDDLESDYVNDAMEQLYDKYIADMKEDIESELIDAGYVTPDPIEVN